MPLCSIPAPSPHVPKYPSELHIVQSSQSDHVNRAACTYVGRAELTAPHLRRAARPENLSIEKGLDGVEGVDMLGVEAGREALEKRAPVQDAPAMRKSSESTTDPSSMSIQVEGGGPGPLTPWLCR